MTAEPPVGDDRRALQDRLAAAEARATRFAEIVHAMRRLNGTVTAERERRPLLARACAELVQSRGWRGVWVVALDARQRPVEIAEAGFGERFARTAQRLARGTLTPCAECALRQGGATLVAELVEPCADCDLAAEHHGRALISRTGYDGHVNGVLYASPHADLADTPEDRAFVADVAASLGFAIHALEVTTAEREAHEDLRCHVERLEELVETRTGELRETVDELQLKTSALDSAMAAIAITDFEGRILLVNRSFLRLWGFARQEQVLGRHASELAPAPRGLVDPAFFAAGERVSEIDAIRADGSVFPARVAVNLVTDAHGEPLAAMASFIDLTEQQAVAARLRAAERQATLAQLARGVGHELRQPLGAIKNASYLLRMVLSDPDPDVVEALGIVEHELEVSSRIIEDLATFAHPPTPAPRRVAIEELVRGALARGAPPPHVAVSLALGEQSPAVFVDPRQIGKAFAHLIANAYQALPRGGTLQVSAAPAEDDQVDVVFADSGVGIAEEDLPQIFDPLFSRKARGIGLGLALARTLVEQNRGAITVQSAPQEGSRFTVRLPGRSPDPER